MSEQLLLGACAESCREGRILWFWWHLESLLVCWVSSHGETVFLVTFDNSQLLGRLVLDASEWLIKDSAPPSGDIQQRLETRLPGRPRRGSSGVCEETPQTLLNILRAQDAPHPRPLHSKAFLVLMLAAECDAGLFASWRLHGPLGSRLPSLPEARSWQHSSWRVETSVPTRLCFAPPRSRTWRPLLSCVPVSGKPTVYQVRKLNALGFFASNLFREGKYLYILS